MTLLLTWRDVLSLINEVDSPPWTSIDGNKCEINIFIDDSNLETGHEIIGSIFKNNVDSNAQIISLYSVGEIRELPINWITDIPMPPALTVYRPIWKSPFTPQAAVRPSGIRIVSFFSYKGGVGRTTALVGTLGAVLEDHTGKVMVVDADLEAPGLTWSLGDESDTLSLADILALIQDSEDWASEVIPLVAASISIKSIETPTGRHEFYFVPAIRNIQQAFAIPVTLEQVIRGKGRAFVIGDFFFALAAALNINSVLIDMRAGLTEFSSPLLLDSRVDVVVVCTCSQQAIVGTEIALQEVAKRISRPSTHVVISMVPDGIAGNTIYQVTARRLVEALLPGTPTEDASDGVGNVSTHRINFAQELIATDDIEQLLSSLIPGTMLGKDVAPAIAASLRPTLPISPGLVPRVTPEEVAKLAEGLEYAEQNDKPALLRTSALRKLATQRPGRLPNAVVLGAKGAGKTFVWGQLLLAGSWAEFAKRVDVTPGKSAKIFPLLASGNLSDPMLDYCQVVENEVLGDRSSRLSRAELLKILGEQPEDVDGLEFWLTAIRKRLGLPEVTGSSLKDLIGVMNSLSLEVVLLVDGLEDALRISPGKSMNLGQQKVMHALLVDMPIQLQELSPAPLGLVTFVRRDLAAFAITQNFGQFEAKHKEVAITWSSTDALRLVLWVLNRAGWELLPEKEIEQASYEKLREKLFLFWNERLGNKEAYSDRWVLAALSDLNGVIQARDLVRFVKYAAKLETKRNFPLGMAAIQKAVPQVAQEKISELVQELGEVSSIFDMLKSISDDKRHIPFTLDEIPLSPFQVNYLQHLGFLLDPDGDGKFYFPEIIRYGLGYKLGRRGRARVISLYESARRVRNF